MTLPRLFAAPVIVFAIINPFSAASASTTTSQPTNSPQIQPAQGDAEQTFVSKINALRASVGAEPLTVDSTLSANAANWARTMASESNMYHQAMTPLPGFAARAENVAYGQSVDQIHEGLSNSLGHYENMTNPEYNKVGIGIAIGTDGNLYVAQEFGSAGDRFHPIS